MIETTIEAGAVRVGDRIFDRGAFHPSAAWVRVTKVGRGSVTWTTQGGHKVRGKAAIITTTNWSTVKHPREGIAVRREGEA